MKLLFAMHNCLRGIVIAFAAVVAVSVAGCGGERPGDAADAPSSSAAQGATGDADGSATGSVAAGPDIAALPPDAEALSLLGEPLRRPELPPEVASEYQANLEEARADLDRAPEDADALVWYGRRLAYPGRYRDAIEVYTRGLELHPGDARLLRHRGHRYVSVREFERAERDLRAAVALVDGSEDVIEPDGLPNAEGIPTSSLHFNIWYHLGLAHYLQGEFEEALLAWNEARRAAHHPDGVIASSYWLNNTLRRLGLNERAERLLAEVSADAEIIEATSYLDVLLLWKGEREVEALTGLEGDALANATTAYGVGAWHFLQGRRERAYGIWEGIVEQGEPWASFGFIAAEAELARLGDAPGPGR